MSCTDDLANEPYFLSHYLRSLNARVMPSIYLIKPNLKLRKGKYVLSQIR